MAYSAAVRYAQTPDIFWSIYVIEVLAIIACVYRVKYASFWSNVHSTIASKQSWHFLMVIGSTVVVGHHAIGCEVTLRL